MAKIMDNLKKTHAAVARDNAVGSGQLGALIGQLAVEALTGGITSDAWRAYMSLFADNEEQFQRLTSNPPPEGEDYLKHARAYIVSNAICAADTGTFVADRVDEKIDGPDGATVSDAVDEAFIAGRPFPIPDIA